MFELEKIEIYKAIIHAIDKTAKEPRFSAFEVDYEEELTMNILRSYIEKIYTSNKKHWAIFKNDSDTELLEKLDSDLNNFMEITKTLSYKIQSKVNKFQDMLPSCEAAFVLFEMGKVMYFACIKMNHQDILVTDTQKVNAGTISSIKKSNIFYSKPKSKIDEGFIVHLKYLDVALLDKTYAVEGEKLNFFSEIVFGMEIESSEYDKLKAFEAINKRVVEKFVGNDLEKQVAIKSAVINSIEENELDTAAFLKAEVFDDNLKPIMENSFEKANLKNIKITVNVAFEKKNMSQNIGMDNGIKINIPTEYVEDNAKFEITFNSNGTTNFVIKNIEEYKIN